jgi:hypothetical protein
MNEINDETKYWINYTDRLEKESDAFFNNGIEVAKERDELKEALENLLKSFKKLDDGSYMELSDGFTQYNIKKAYEILNKYKTCRL